MPSAKDKELTEFCMPPSTPDLLRTDEYWSRMVRRVSRAGPHFSLKI